MFETEAEEYYYKTYPVTLNIGEEERKKKVTDIFIKSAEFGYNKAKEEMQEQGLALQSDMDKTIEQNIQLKNQNNWLEGCKLELAEHLGKANDRVSELEQQIEKMKRCVMCKYHTSLGYCRIRQKGGVCENHDKWEMKEND